MKKYKLCALLLYTSLISALFTGCGDGSKSISESVSNDASVGFSPSASVSAPEPLPEDDAQRPNTKLIYTASVSAETTEFPQTISEIESLVKRLQGYIEHSNQSGEIGSRSVSYTLRIPQNQYASFLSQVGSLCTVTHKSEDLQDISELYFDRENRLKAQKIKQERLLSLLQKATKMEDIIALENALAEVQSEIDTLTGTLNKYDSLVNFSTIELHVNEVHTLSTIPETMAFGSDMKRAFTEGTYGFIHFIQALLIALASIWPFVLIVFTVVFILIFIRIRKYKISKSKNNWASYSPSPKPTETQAPTYFQDETPDNSESSSEDNSNSTSNPQ